MAYNLFLFPQVYYVYGFMLLVFLILIIVTVCVTIVGTYFLLNAENYHWQWTSFFSAASTAVYVYFYSIYYYYVKTKMSGFFQTSFYFGYTLMFCLGLGILCGEFLHYWQHQVRTIVFSFAYLKSGIRVPSEQNADAHLRANFMLILFYVLIVLIPFVFLFLSIQFKFVGAVGYLGSNLFVRRIYRNIKCD